MIQSTSIWSGIYAMNTAVAAAAANTIAALTLFLPTAPLVLPLLEFVLLCPPGVPELALPASSAKPTAGPGLARKTEYTFLRNLRMDLGVRLVRFNDDFGERTCHR